MVQTNSAFLTDSYKLAHHDQYPEGTTLVFSNFTPRTNKYASEATKSLDSVLVFGVQLTLMKIRDHFNQNFFFTSERGDKNFPWNAGNLVELKKKAIDPIKEEIELFLGMEYDTTHFERLWDLGYLPLEIRALDEGTLCPIKVPMLTIHNTHPDFFWLPNFLETILSQMLWKPMTSATIALSYRKTMEKWAEKTNPEGKEFVLWQGHDFSMRGLDAVEATQASGLGHLSVFYGTDSLPTLSAARYYYGAQGFIAGSVPATEHSVMSAGSKEGELETFRRLMKKQPKGILSVVSDTWDLWNVLTNILPQLKEEIMARDGKLVIRPDSGDPVDIICGTSKSKYNFLDVKIEGLNENIEEVTTEDLEEYLSGDVRDFWSFDSWDETDEDFTQYFIINNKIYSWTIEDTECIESTWDGRIMGWESTIEFVEDYKEDTSPEMKGAVEILWDVFGGTVNEQGYKVLDSHIGLIYGDSITLERCQDICARLEAKGFASTNVVFGIGSFTYQFNTRDTFGFAMKATYIEKTEYSNQFLDVYERTGFEIFKDPKTDSGLKKSAKGLLKVIQGENGLELVDQISWEELRQDDNLLTVVFKDGKFLKETTMAEIRNRVNKLI